MSIGEIIRRVDIAARRERLSSPETIQRSKAVRFPGRLQRANTQEAGQSDGKVSVKLVNAAGTESGSAFDVYAFASKASSDMGDYVPAITSGMKILVAQVNGEWFMVWPSLISESAIKGIFACP